jgi:hypothetical protein
MGRVALALVTVIALFTSPRFGEAQQTNAILAA